MNSLVIEVQGAIARSIAVGETALTVDLVDGRTIIVPLGFDTGKELATRMAKGLDEASTSAVCIGAKTPKGWFQKRWWLHVN